MKNNADGIEVQTFSLILLSLKGNISMLMFTIMMHQKDTK